MQSFIRVGLLALLTLLAFFTPTSAQRSSQRGNRIAREDISNHAAKEPHACLTDAPPAGFDYVSPWSDMFDGKLGENGEESTIACSSGSARTNTNLPLNLESDFVPLTGDDSRGFYVVYSAKANAEGTAAENNVGIYLFRLESGAILMFGSGYGDPFGPGTALFDAAYDMARVDQVIRGCMGGGPARSPIIFVTPHGHGDHINPAAFRELRARGYQLNEIWFHSSDEVLINVLGGWSAADQTAFRRITGGAPCSDPVLSFDAHVGRIWFMLRPGHTGGALDLVVDIEGETDNRVVVRGSGNDGNCPLLGGTRELVSAHGNVMLRSESPTFLQISPDNGTPLGGTEVTLTGRDFLAEGAGTPRVLFNGAEASDVQVVDDSTITARAPESEGGTSASITVVNRNGQDGMSSAFTYAMAPSLGQLSPTEGPPTGGFRVVIDGSGFMDPNAGETNVLFGNVVSTRVRVKSDTQIVARAPLGESGETVPVIIENGNGRSNAGFLTFSQMMSVNTLRPHAGPAAGGTAVTLTGKGFLEAGRLTVKFDGTRVRDVVVLDDTTATFTTPAGTPGAEVNVHVSNRNGDTVLLNGFTYNMPPMLASISPTMGIPGAMVTIKGARFLDMGTGGTRIHFGDQEAMDAFVISDDMIACTAPEGSGTVDIILSNDNGTDTLVGGWTFESQLMLTAASPEAGSGFGGTSVTLSGTGFAADPSALEVRFGNRSATAITVLDDATLVCNTPMGQPGSVVDIVVVDGNQNAATLVGGYRYFDAPVLLSAQPSSGPAAGGTLVLLYGSGFQADAAGTNEVMFGSQLSPVVTVLDDTSLLVETPAGAPGATVDIGVSNGNGMIQLSDAFTYDAPAPTLSSITPDSGPATGGTTVTLSGAGFLAPNSGTTTVFFGTEPASAVLVLDDSTVQCQTPPGLPGLVAVTVENGNGEGALASAFRYLEGLTLTAISPDSGTSVGGPTLTLTGTGFNSPTAGTTRVQIGGTLSSTVTVLSDSTLTATLPPGTPGEIVDIVVTNDNSTTNLAGAFRYHGAPALTSLSPSRGSALGGTLITLEGTGFVIDGAGAPVVEFGSVPAAEVTVLDDGSILCTSPAGTPDATVEVTVENTNGVAILPLAFTFDAPAPALVSIAPLEGPLTGGTTLTLTGTSFTASGFGANAVFFDGIPASNVQTVDGTTITCETPASLAGLVDVTVTNENGSATLADGFRFLDGLTTSSLAPQSAAAAGGVLVTISGEGFASSTAGSTTVTFDGVPATNVSILSDDTLTCEAPAGTPGILAEVVVSNHNATALLPEAFRYHALPFLLLASPTSGPPSGGTIVLLQGSGFTSDAAGPPAVSFGDTPSPTVTVMSDVSLLCEAPAGSPLATVDLTITNANGQATLTGGFSYEAFAPTLISIAPDHGSTDGGELLTLTGTGFRDFNPGTNTVNIGGAPATGITVLSDTQLTCIAPAGTAGLVDVLLSNDNGAALATDAFRYIDGLSLASITPDSTSSLGGATLTLSGQGFASSTAGITTVTIGGTSATNVVVIDDSTLTCTLPAGPAGSSAGIQVTNENGAVSLPAALRYHALPTLAFLSPANGSGAGGTSVLIFGSGFAIDDAGDATILFGDTPAAGVSVLDDTSILCLTPAGTPAAMVDVTLSNANGSAVLAEGFQYDAPMPTLTSIAPLQGVPTGGTLVTLTGTGFADFQPGPTNVLFGNIPGSNVSILDDTTLTVLSPAGPAGISVDVTIVNENGGATLQNAFLFLDELTTGTLVPESAPASGGMLVTISGEGFNSSTAGVTSVTFDGVPATGVSIQSDGLLTCQIPAGTPGAVVDVVVSNANGTALLPSAFRYHSLPAILSLSPSAGTSAGGTTVQLHGHGFSIDSAGPPAVSFGGTPALSVSVLGDDSVLCETPAGTPLSSVDVTLTNANGSTTLLDGFTYEPLAPTLSSISPARGYLEGGTLVTLQGTGFADFNAGINTVAFGGAPATAVTVLSDSEITCLSPASAAGLVDILLENANGTTVLVDAFRYLDGLSTSAIAPESAAATGSVLVTISGEGFSSSTAGLTTVTFDGIPATSVSIVSDDSLTCLAPAGAAGAIVDVVVSNDNATALLPAAFRYHSLPAILSISPSSGTAAGGTSVLIQGSGFEVDSAGAPAVSFGGLPALTASVMGDDSVLCEAPAGAPLSSVDVTLTNANGSTTLAGGFTYEPLAPTLLSIAPPRGIPSGGTLVTLFGTGFADFEPGINNVLFGNASGTSVSVLDDSTLTVVSPEGPAGQLVDVTVVNANGAATLIDSFLFLDELSTGTIAPQSAASTGGTLVSITGEGFASSTAGPTTVTFDGVPATNVSILSDDTLTCLVPMGAPGSTVDVVVSNDNATAVLLEAFRYHAQPAILSISPTSGEASGGTSVLIHGSGFSIDAAGPPSVSFSGISALSVAVITDDTVVCESPAGTPLSSVDVTLSNANGASTLPGAFTYDALPPTLAAITPDQGFAAGGELVTLTGSGFSNFNPGINIVSFGGALATAVTVLSDTQLTCITPAGLAGLVDVVLSNDNGAALSSDAFRYIDNLFVASISTESASSLGGATLTVSGQGFSSATAGTTTVEIGGNPAANVVVLNDTTLTCTIPAGAAGSIADIVVSNANAAASLPAALRYHAVPTLAFLSPSNGSGVGGTSVLVFGTGFAIDSPGATIITFDGSPATGITVLDDTSILCLTPAGVPAATVDVTLSNANGSALLAGGFQYDAPMPTLTSISPLEGAPTGGTVVTLQGSGFADFNPGITNVLFGNTPGSNVSVIDDTSLTVLSPGGPAGISVDVTVLNDNGAATLLGAFQYRDDITVAGVSPTNGRASGGDILTISGTDFMSPTAGTTHVFFGPIEATGVTILSNTLLSVTSPAGFAGSTVDVTVSNDNGSSTLPAAYRYNAAPTISMIFPESGRSLGDTLLTISGSGFLADDPGMNTVRVNGVEATQLQVLSDDTLQCKAPSGPPGASVDVQISNANGEALLASAYRYHNLPTLTSLSPDRAPARGGAQITLQGSGFSNEAPGSTLVTFGGLAAASVVVLSDDMLICELPAGAPGAVVDVAIENDNGAATIVGGFTYNAPPVIASLSVDGGSSLGGTFLSISGSGFLDNEAGPITVSFGGLQATGVTVLTDSELICSTPTGIPGTQVDVVVASQNGDGTLIGGFQFHPLPEVLALTPPNGSLNGSTLVQITGSGFLDRSPGLNLVSFGGTPASSVTVLDDTTLTCLTPAGTGGSVVDVRVSNNNGEATLFSAYTYDDGPTITSLLPAEGSTLGGTSVLIFGVGFQNGSSGAADVSFGGTPAANVQVLADTAILCDTPVGNPGAVDVVVSNENGTATFPAAYTYQAPQPELTHIAPVNGSSLGGTLLTLTGKGFANFLPGTNSVLIEGAPALNVTVINDTTLSCLAPEGLPGTLADVVLTNDNGSANLPSSFRYHSLPSVSSIAPTSGSALGSTRVTLTGSGFLVDEAGEITVTFDGIPATSVQILDDTTLTCDTPPGAAGAVADLRIENANGPSALASAFRYHTVPTISSIIPPSGSSLGGTSLLLVGSGFLSDAAGPPTILIGGLPAMDVTVLDDNGITLNVPEGTAGARVTIQLQNSNGAATLGEAFRYHDLPEITAVSPAFGSSEGGDTLLLTGVGFQKDLAGANTILIGGTPATAISVLNDTSLTCVTPLGTPGTTVDIRVNNANGEVLLPSSFRYNSRPVIAGITPQSGTSLGGTALILTGEGFLADNAGPNTVRFAGLPATSVTVLDDNTLSVLSPGGAPGSNADITVENANGAALLASGFRFHGEPTLSSLSPSSGAAEGGLQVVIEGSGFQADAPGLNSVTFGGILAADVVVIDDATLHCTLPPGTEGATVDLAILNANGGDILPNAFTYNMPPGLTTVVPASGSNLGGATITLVGARFLDPGAGTNVVLFGETPAENVLVLDDHTITCTLPAGSGGVSVDVSLQNNNGTVLLENGFHYYAGPTVTSLTPASGTALGATSVLIFGSGFLSNNAGPLSVSFGENPATEINIFSDTAFLCASPAGPPGAPVSIEVSNANGTAILADAYTYQAPAPTVTGATPPTGSPLGGTPVTITGTGFAEFTPGTNLVTFGGVLATDVTVLDDNTLTCTAPAGPAGSLVDVRIQNDNGSNLLLNGFRFHSPPTLTSVAPASGSSIGSLVINITGMGFEQDAGVTSVLIGSQAATDVVVVSDTMLTCMAPSGTPGTSVDVTVSNANGSATLGAAFRYHDLPTLALIAPNHGSSLGGTQLTLSGSGFQSDGAGLNAVTFDGVPATNLVVVDDTTLTCTSPAGIAGGYATIELTNANGAVSMPIAFRYHAQPVLASASPVTGRSSGGTTVLLFGSGFTSDDAGAGLVTFDGIPATNLMVFSNTAMLCDTPAGTRNAAVDISFSNDNGTTTLSGAFTYTASTPLLSAVAPSIGSSLGGTLLTLTGKDYLDPARGTTTVLIGGQPAANLVIVSDTTITVEVPAGTPGSMVDVVVSNDNGSTVLSGGFAYASLPTLSVLLPDNGSSRGGDVVLLSGSGFSAYGAGINTVSFGGLPATLVTVLDDSTIQATTPVPVAMGQVEVSISNTNGTATLPSGFHYRQPPTLVFISELSGSSIGGESLTLTGFDFEALGFGTTEVLFDDIPATDVVVESDTEITCTIPTGAAGEIVDVSVRNDNGTSTLSDAYRLHDLPTISSITPAQAAMMGGSSVSIEGTGFLDDSAGTNLVAFGGTPAVSVTVLSDTLLTCLVPAGVPGASVDVTVTNANGQALRSGGFAYHAAPTLLSIHPSTGSSIGGQTITLTGSGFLDNNPAINLITVGGFVANDVTVLDDSTLTCTIPLGTPGLTVDIRVDNANGNATLASAYRFHDAPAITSISPPSGTSAGGTSIVINGSGFQAYDAGANTILFGGLTAQNVTVFGDTAILCDSPGGIPLTTVDVTVLNNNGQGKLPSAFAYVAPTPQLSAVAPASGSPAGGTLVTLTGQGFLDYEAGTNTVLIGGQPVTDLTILSDTVLTCLTPAGSSNDLATIELTNSNGTALLESAYRFHSAPSLLTISPSAGSMLGSTPLILTGTGFLANGAGVNSVTFGSVQATNVFVIDDETLSCLAPAGASGALVTVTVSNANGSTALDSGYSYHAAPAIIGATPTNAAAAGGETITIAGSGFHANEAGLNAIRFGGALASNVTVIDDSLLTCELPAGLAGSLVDIQLTNANGSSFLPLAFSYNALPTLTSLSPFSAGASGGTAIVVTGSGFTLDGAGVNQITFGGIPAANVVVVDDSTLTCELPAGTPGSIVSVVLTNANGQASLPASFTYNGLPIVTELTPSTVSSMGGVSVLVSGENFIEEGTQEMSVTFDGIPATNVVVLDDNTLSCVVPAGTAGAMAELRIENKNGQASVPGALRFHDLPTLGAVGPFEGAWFGGDTVTLTGSGFQVDNPGTNQVSFGGLLAASVTVIDDTTLTCEVPEGIAGLSVDVAISNANGSALLPAAYHYFEIPTLLSVTPDSGTSLGGQSVVLSGTGFAANAAGAATVLFGGIPAANVTVLDDITLLCDIPTGFAGQFVNVEVSNANGGDMLSGGFQFNPLPVVAEIFPAIGTAMGGELVTITGSGFLSRNAGANTVTLGGLPLTGITVIDDTTITALTPLSRPSETADIVVSNTNGTSSPLGGFRYHDAPTLAGVSPNSASASGGALLSLSGSGFLNNSAGTNIVTIGSMPALNVSVSSDQTLTCEAPPGLQGTVADIRISNGNGSTTLVGGFRYHAAPVITGLSPDSIPATGGPITLLGSGFLADSAGTPAILIDGMPAANVVVVDDAMIVCEAPVGVPGASVDVQLTNENGTALLPGALAYRVASSLSGILPISSTSIGGEFAVLMGDDFLAEGAGVPTVTVGGNPVTNLTVVNDHTITMYLPAGAPGAVTDVALSNENGTTLLTSAFRYHALPTVTGISPDQGATQGGELLTLSGTGFLADQAGVNTVTLGGTPALNVMVLNDSTLMFEAPANASGNADIQLSNFNGHTALTAAYSYYIPLELSSVSPSQGLAVGGTDITLTGSGFAFEALAPDAVRIDGVPALNLTVVNDSTLTCTTPPGTGGESVQVSVANSTSQASLAAGFYYIDEPTIGSLTPNSGTSLGGTQVTLSGMGLLDFSAGIPFITFDGLAATNVTVVDDATVTCEAPAGLAGTLVTVDVVNQNGSTSLTSAFRYHALPTVTGITPDQGATPGGEFVTLTGTGFLADQAGVNTVTLGGVETLNVMVVDDNTLICLAPANASGTADIQLTNSNGQASMAAAYFYYIPLELNSVSPPQGIAAGGTDLTLTGSGFTFESLAPDAVRIDGVPALNLVVVDDSTITCTTPPGTGGESVQVSVSNSTSEASMAAGFFYIEEPTLGGLTPNSGTSLGGTTVTLSGMGLLEFSAGVPFITFDGIPATNVTVIDDATVTCETPAGLASTLVTVDVVNLNGSTSLESAFRYHALPTVSGITPDQGASPGGTLVTITGSGFAVDQPGDHTVMIGGAVASSVSVVDDNTLTCLLPAHSGGPSDVIVSNDNGAALLPSGFFYFVPLTLSSISPATGFASGGTLLTLTGSGFSFETLGEGSVRIGGLDALNPVVVDDTTLTCEAPAGAPGQSVLVEVLNTTSQASMPEGFAYLSAPELLGVTPPAGTSLGGTQLTLVGSGFLEGEPGTPTITIGGVPATAITVVDDGTITCEAPAGIAASTAMIELVNLRGSSEETYDYHPTPQVMGITPDRVDTEGGTEVTVTGTGFLDNDAGTATVTFGFLPALNVTVIDDTTLTCEAGPGSLRTVGDVTVTNDNGEGTLPGGVMWLPQIPADINDDGYADLIVGAPGHFITSVNDGAVYVFFGGPDGIADANAENADLIFLPTMNNTEFGGRLAAMDVTGDDVPDLMISAHKDDTAGIDAGAVFVFHGPLTPMETPILSSSADVVLQGKATGDTFGVGIDTGDISGDGIPDLVISAKNHDGIGQDSGEVYGFFGGPSLASTNAMFSDATFTPMNHRSEFGTRVRVVDFDGDGTSDVVIGAAKDSVAGGNSGSVYIFRGHALLGTVAAANADWAFTGEAPGDFFGSSLAVGDVNDDTMLDLVVGAPLNDRSHNIGGATYVFFGGPDQAGGSASGADVIFGSELAGDRMGSWIDVADVNGDFVDDILIGSPFSSVTATRAGRAYVVFGTSLLADMPLSMAPVIFTAEPDAGGQFGSVITAQDVDGDGWNDVIVSAAMADANGAASGRTYVFMGGPDLTDGNAASDDATLTGGAASDGFGSWVVGSR